MTPLPPKIPTGPASHIETYRPLSRPPIPPRPSSSTHIIDRYTPHTQLGSRVQDAGDRRSRMERDRWEGDDYRARSPDNGWDSRKRRRSISRERGYERGRDWRERERGPDWARRDEWSREGDRRSSGMDRGRGYESKVIDGPSWAEPTNPPKPAGKENLRMYKPYIPPAQVKANLAKQSIHGKPPTIQTSSSSDGSYTLLTSTPLGGPVPRAVVNAISPTSHPATETSVGFSLLPDAKCVSVNIPPLAATLPPPEPTSPAPPPPATPKESTSVASSPFEPVLPLTNFTYSALPRFKIPHAINPESAPTVLASPIALDLPLVGLVSLASPLSLNPSPFAHRSSTSQDVNYLTSCIVKSYYTHQSLLAAHTTLQTTHDSLQSLNTHLLSQNTKHKLLENAYAALQREFNALEVHEHGIEAELIKAREWRGQPEHVQLVMNHEGLKEDYERLRKESSVGKVDRGKMQAELDDVKRGCRIELEREREEKGVLFAKIGKMGSEIEKMKAARDDVVTEHGDVVVRGLRGRIAGRERELDRVEDERDDAREELAFRVRTINELVGKNYQAHNEELEGQRDELKARVKVLEGELRGRRLRSPLLTPPSTASPPAPSSNHMDLQKRYAAVQDELHQAESSNAVVSAQFLDLQTAHDTLQEQYVRRKAQLKERDVAYEEMRNANEAHALELSDKEVECEAVKEEMNVVNEKLAGMQSELESVKGMIIGKEKMITDQGMVLDLAEKKLVAVIAEKASLQGDVESLNNRIFAYATQLEETSAQLAKTQLELSTSTADCSNLRAEGPQIKAQLDNALIERVNIKEHHEALRDRLEALDIKHNEYVRRASNLETIHKDLEAQHHALKDAHTRVVFDHEATVSPNKSLDKGLTDLHHDRQVIVDQTNTLQSTISELGTTITSLQATLVVRTELCDKSKQEYDNLKTSHTKLETRNAALIQEVKRLIDKFTPTREPAGLRIIAQQTQAAPLATPAQTCTHCSSQRLYEHEQRQRTSIAQSKRSGEVELTKCRGEVGALKMTVSGLEGRVASLENEKIELQIQTKGFEACKTALNNLRVKNQIDQREWKQKDGKRVEDIARLRTEMNVLEDDLAGEEAKAGKCKRWFKASEEARGGVNEKLKVAEEQVEHWQKKEQDQQTQVDEMGSRVADLERQRDEALIVSNRFEMSSKLKLELVLGERDKVIMERDELTATKDRSGRQAERSAVKLKRLEPQLGQLRSDLQALSKDKEDLERDKQALEERLVDMEVSAMASAPTTLEIEQLIRDNAEQARKIVDLDGDMAGMEVGSKFRTETIRLLREEVKTAGLEAMCRRCKVKVKEVDNGKWPV